MQPTEAKAHLIRQILIEAGRENIPLTAIERQMLEFSETENTPPNWQQLNAEFDRGYEPCFKPSAEPPSPAEKSPQSAATWR